MSGPDACQGAAENDAGSPFRITPGQIHSRLLHQPTIQFLLAAPCRQVALMICQIWIMDMAERRRYRAEIDYLALCLER